MHVYQRQRVCEYVWVYECVRVFIGHSLYRLKSIIHPDNFMLKLNSNVLLRANSQPNRHETDSAWIKLFFTFNLIVHI